MRLLMKNRLLLIFFIPFILCAQSCFRDIWVDIKYSDMAKEDRLNYLTQFVEKAKPLNKEDKLWILVAQSTRMSLLPKFKALDLSKEVIQGFENELNELNTPTEKMAAGILAYIYAKVPGWPIGIGSKQKSKEWIEKIKAFDQEADVAFYLAQAYFYLDKKDLSKNYKEIALKGYEADCTLYSHGRVNELNLLIYSEK